MLQFQGERAVAKPATEVFTKLGDARFLVECISGVEKVSEAEPDHAAFVIRPGLSFVRGTLNVTIDVLEREAERKLRLIAHSKGIGSGNDVEAEVMLDEREGKTLVQWSAEVKNFTGLLKAVPRGLLQGAAEKAIGDIWNTIEEKLNA